MKNIEKLANFQCKISLSNNSFPYSKDCLINASNDFQAVAVWLSQYKNSPATLAAYSKESERLVLWCIYQRGLTLNDLKLQDFESYFTFLQQPPPSWCTTRANLRSGRNSKNWKPFIGPLSSTSLQAAIRVLNSLMNYLEAAQYIRHNPIKLIKNYNKFNLDYNDRKYQVLTRMLEENEWQAIQAVLVALPENSIKEKISKSRSHLLFALLYLLGLRINEVVTHKWNNFKYQNGQWWFFVRGKGNKLGSIPVNQELLVHIQNYRELIGKPKLPNDNDHDSLFMSTKEKSYSQRWLYNLVKSIGLLAAEKFPKGSQQYHKLIALSPHWLRHLSASHQNKLGIPANMIQANHRHSSWQTTQIYLHSEENLRAEEMQKMSMINSSADTSTNTSTSTNVGLTLIIEILSKKNPLLPKLINMIELHILANINWQKQYDSNNNKFIYELNHSSNLDILINKIELEAAIRMIEVKVSLFRP